MSDTNMPNPGMTAPDRSASSGLTNADLAPVVRGLATTTEQLKSTSAQLIALAQQLEATAPVNVVAASVISPQDPGDFGISAADAGSSVGTATNALKQVQNLGFVDFTVGLINGTFDAVIGATVKQMQAYTEMVKQLDALNYIKQAHDSAQAKYPQVAVGNQATQDDINTFTGTYKLDAGDVPQPNTPYTSDQVKLINAAVLSNQIAAEITVGGSATDPVLTKLKNDWAVQSNLPSANGRYTKQNILDIAAAASQQKSSYDLLEFVKIGMARIVIDEGQIHSKLTFDVSVDSQSTVDRETSNTNTTNASLDLKLKKNPWLKGGLNVNTTNVNVRSVSEKTFDKVTMNAEIIGEVMLHFSTQTFPTGPSTNGAAPKAP
jgi:hypothetical protein